MRTATLNISELEERMKTLREEIKERQKEYKYVSGKVAHYKYRQKTYDNSKRIKGSTSLEIMGKRYTDLTPDEKRTFNRYKAKEWRELHKA